MKLGDFSFGIKVVVSGQKVANNVSVPELIANNSQGSFTLTAGLTKKMGLQNGDFLMFLNNLSDVQAAVNSRIPQIEQLAAEHNIDLNTKEGVDAIIRGLAQWYIAKGIAKRKQDGTPVMCAARITKTDKINYLNANMDEFVAENREALIVNHDLDAAATDDDIKAVITVDDVPTPEIPAFNGCKLSTNSNATGVGVKLTCSDSATWAQLREGIEPNHKRVFTIDEKNVAVVPVNDGYEDVKVTVYPITFKEDIETTVRTKKEETTETTEFEAEVVED